MALLLHLADLHLGLGEDQQLGDSKVRVVPADAQETRVSVIKHSLTALREALVEAGRTLDGVIVNGDVTVKANADGFTLLPEVLACLGDRVTHNSRILITPGNHDVVRSAAPGSASRYSLFTPLRRLGYTFSYMEGVTAERAGEFHDAHEPVLAATDGSFVVVGMNSVDNAGASETPETELAPYLSRLEGLASRDKAVSALMTAWKHRGAHDVARVGPKQLSAARKLLNTHGSDSRAQLRMIALHHPVAPITATEEFKTFESITNTAAVLDWLVDNKVDIVLTGHKHQGRIAPLIWAHTVSGQQRDLLIVSAPTIEAGTNQRSNIGQLLDISGPAPRRAGMRIASIPASSAGGSLTFEELDWHEQTIARHTPSEAIAGRDVDEVYEQLVARQTRLRDFHWPLVCRIDEGPTGLRLPARYPVPAGETDQRSWANEIVDFWLQSAPSSAAPFTHGNRLRRWGIDDTDQFIEARERLKNSPLTGTSRAIATLIDPRVDKGERGRFPAFTLLQFLFRDGLIDVIAYYRKQEMPHWWPFNVMELARLQLEMVEGVPNSKAGAITTITAHPVSGSGMPQVSIPLIDRQADQPARFASWVLRLLRPAGFPEPDPEALIEDWERLLAWVPDLDNVPADGDIIPIHGLIELENELKAIRSLIPPSTPADALIELIQSLRMTNEQQRDRDEPAQYMNRRDWVRRVHSLRQRILEQVAKLARRSDN